MKINAFEDVLTDYFFSKALRPATEWSYRKVVKSFLGFAGSNILLNDVDKKMVLTWRRSVIADNTLSKRTWNNKVAHMRAIFNHAIAQGYFSYRENPFNGVIARPDVKRKRTLSDIQIKKSTF
jgi:integrase